MLNLPTSRVHKATVNTCSSEGNLTEFLSKSGRKVRHTIPDGNCLFRSLSINLYNHEDKHLAIRKVLVEFEELNKDQFANYLTISDATNINDHICSMARPFVWGTQVELLAASSFFQVPICYCQASQGTYRWHMLGPVSETQNLKYPADTHTLGIKVKHFELVYHTGVHYDSIVNQSTNRVSTTPPSLSGSTSYMEIQ